MTTQKQTNKKQRQIVAIGGALSKEPSSGTLMLKYIFKHCNNPNNPRLLFINTASGDDPKELIGSYEMAAQLNCKISHLTFFERTPADLSSLIMSQDVIFVGGGNTKSMLAVWQEYGLGKLLYEAWQIGIILAGSSAGGICWFDECVTDSIAGSFTTLPALGFFHGSCCPHYDEPGRKGAYHQLLSSGKIMPGYAIDERVALHFIGESLHQVVSAANKDIATAYKVCLNTNGIVQEEILQATRISKLII